MRIKRKDGISVKRRILTLSAVITMLICMPAAVRAAVTDRGECGASGNEANVTWRYDDTGVLTISGTGRMADYDSQVAPWERYSRDIREVVVDGGVTNIGASAFGFIRGIESVAISEGVTEIGEYAFEMCGNLTTVSLPGTLEKIGEYAFFHCAVEGDVNISASVSEIGEGAFSGCDISAFNVAADNDVYASDNGVLYNAGKTTLIMYPQTKTGAYAIPEGVAQIEYGAFSDCAGLTKLTIPASVADIGGGGVSENSAFSGCGCESYEVNPDNAALSSELGVLFSKDRTHLVAYPGAMEGAYVIPEEVKYIDAGAFEGNAKLRTVSIPGNVEEIGKDAFYGSAGLRVVIIQDGVKRIGANAFGECGGLEEIAIPGSVENIGSGAFMYCDMLREVTIREGAGTVIGESVFESCTRLYSATIPAGVTAIEERAFTDCSALDEINVDDNAVCVGRDTFEDTKYYKNDRNWTNGVLYIGAHLVDTNTGIGKYVIKSGTTTVSDGAFARDTGLSEIAVPSSVIYIGSGAFGNGGTLQDIYYEGARAQWESADIADTFEGVTIHYLADEPADINAEVSVTDKDGSRVFNITANPRPYSRVYAVVYDANGVVTAVGTADLDSDGGAAVELNKTDADISAKVFIWDGAMRALCTVPPVGINRSVFKQS